jgi:hypothetical protein
MGTRESQSDAQTSANNQLNNKALKLTNQEQEVENSPPKTRCTEDTISPKLELISTIRTVKL